MEIGEIDLAKKLSKQGIGQFEQLEAIDTDSDNPNLPRKAWWPSTAVLLRLIAAAADISKQTADETLQQISTPELRF